jgi:hypothetical protein
MRALPAVLAAALVLLAGPRPSSSETAAERIARDARAGRPLVAHVFVALCDNQHQGIVPVPARLGNGQRPDENLYWGARYGLRSYFRRAAGWQAVPHAGSPPAGILDRVVFRRQQGGAPVYVVADAWDGARIRETVSAFLEAAAGRATVTTTAGRELAIGGGSHVVAFVGHNGLMDFEAPPLAPGRAEPARAAVVLACASRPYFLPLLQRAQAQPLLLTTGLMAPEAYSLEAALSTWFATRDGAQAKDAAAHAYDTYQRCGRRAALRLFATGE